MQSLPQFFSEVWEKKAQLYKADPSREQLFPKLCSLDFLKELASAEGASLLSFTEFAELNIEKTPL